MLLYEFLEPSKKRKLTETGLTFKGYPCTVDCMGHQAGHDWATRWGINEPEECPYGHSNSFWEGCKSKTEEEVTEELDEGQIIDHDAFMDVYLKGKHQGEMIQKKVGERIPNRLVNAFIDKVAKKFGLNPTAFVYGPCQDQVVDEMAGEIHGGIRKVLRDKGYEYIDSGIDKQVWREPSTGQILVIFGYRKGYKQFSPDQKMFVDWVRYCEQHKNNPHLPKFSGLESFQFRGQTYIQSRMEPLTGIPNKIKNIVVNIDEHLRHYDEVDVLAVLKNLVPDDPVEGPKYIKQIINNFGGIESLTSLFKTIQQVAAFGDAHGFNLDLHGGNYMQRADGTIVVNDPFVIWLGGSGG